MQATPAQVHAFVGDLEKWDEWTPWIEDDPSIVTTFGEKTVGVGAHQSWTSESGDGELTLTQSDELAFRVVFDGEIPRNRDLYWRGLVYSEFENGTWSVGPELPAVPRSLRPDGSRSLGFGPTPLRALPSDAHRPTAPSGTGTSETPARSSPGARPFSTNHCFTSSEIIR